MGFIEKLRQQKEEEALARRQQEVELSRTRAVEEAARKQRETQERELHQQRKQQAETYSQESGVENLLARLASVISGSDSPDLISVGVDYYDQYLRRDVDSKMTMIRWEARKIGECRDRRADNKGYIEKWGIYQAKSFTVECSPEGTIYFNGGLFSSSTISERTWRNNQNVFDTALERAFKRPRIIRFTGNHRSEYVDTSG